MCGIFGLALKPGADGALGAREARAVLARLFLLSESRGREAAGLAVARHASPSIAVHKEPIPASRMIKGRAYRGFLDGNFGEGSAVIGHSRLVTNGSRADNANNQPVASGSLAAVHNGIIVNDADLWRAHPDLRRDSEVDSEVLVKLMESFRARGDTPAEACRRAYSLLEGSASIAMLMGGDGCLLLATNVGSLFYAATEAYLVFASEKFILETALDSAPLDAPGPRPVVTQLRAGRGLLIDLRSLAREAFTVPLSSPRANAGAAPSHGYASAPEPARLKRCVRCILPETMPFIRFDAQGVCNFCRDHKPMRLRGAKALEAALAPYRRKGEADCIVAFSGGRDSSYGLHYLKTEMGMSPIAFTYDWGMVTDLARRNQARICGKLGIEHILVSADITGKREFIRKNVEAWMRRPHLGMIPLFMAGDKQFFYHANRLQKETGIDLVVFCNNNLETTLFKTGFMGVHEGRTHTATPWLEKASLVFSYLREFLRNPAYLNASLPDTVFSYVSAYLIAHDYLNVYDYIPWDEGEINRTLIREYGWETATDTPSTWRIGDGTASFYNHIYRTVAGFNEFDTFRSNQIREGMLTRDEALRLLREENTQRMDSMREYARLVGFDLDRALRAVDRMPKLFNAA